MSLTLNRSAWNWAALVLLFGAGLAHAEISPAELSPAERLSLELNPGLHVAPSPMLQQFAPDGDCNIVLASRDNRPLLVLNTGGPQGLVRALCYSPNGDRLYAGGLDKAVHVFGFQVEPRSVKRSARNQAVQVQTLRWEIARAALGQILSLAASPSGRQVAIAGINARVTDLGLGGDIVIYDTARGEVERVLHGHRGPVVSISYSPSGQRIVTAGGDGQVFIWDAANQWQPQVAYEGAAKSATSFGPVDFLDENTFLYSIRPTEKDEWKIVLGNASNPQDPPKVLDQVHRAGITAIAIDRAHKRFATGELTGNGTGRVYLWTGFDQPKSKLLREGRLPLSMDFDTAGRLFVGTALRFYPDGTRQAVLEMWDVDAGKMIDSVEASKHEHVSSCKVSPDGSRIALYAPDTAELWVYLLKDRQGQLIDKPLRAVPLRLAGRGAPVESVAFSKEGYRVGIKSRGAGNAKDKPAGFERGFDMEKVQPLGAEDATKTEWQSTAPTIGTWAAKISPLGDKVVIENAGEKWAEIGMDSRAVGLATCATFLTTPNAKQPFAIAVGTKVQNLILVYGIRAKDEAPKLLRAYRDHAGEITSLSASADGRYLASSSNDQSIKVWSLEGIQSLETRFGQSVSWGASFLFEEDQILVRGVLEAGNVTRRGIREGDVVVEARFEPRIMDSLGFPMDGWVRDARTILRGLESTAPYETVVMTLKRRGSNLNRKVLIVPAWAPMATLFTDRQGDWAFFSPLGYFDSSVEGDELFGWQINRGQETKPDFFRADQFRGQLERPAAMRQLLSAGSIQQALRLTDEAPDETDPVAQAASKTPRVTIVSPTDAQELGAGKVPLVARIEFPDAASAERLEGIAFVNGVPGRVVNEQERGNERTYEWSAESYDRFNRLRVVATGAEEDPAAFADVHFRLRDAGEVRKPRLNLLVVAAGDYQNVAKLEFPVKDAEAILKSLEERSGELYELGKVSTLTDAQITRESVAKEIETWKSDLAEAASDDLTVVFLAGHGIAVRNQYFFVPTGLREPQAIVESGIGWETFQELSELPCKKLFLLDTCHSGNVLPDQKAIAQNLKSAIRPLKQGDMMVITATEAGQEALEIASLGHGVFTQSILDALSGQADRQKDQSVDLQEVVEFVAADVPRRTRGLQLQTPRAYPTDLINAISVPLVTIR